MNKKAICAAALVLSGAASAVQTEAATVYKKMEVVNTTSLNLRKGPSTKYAKLGTVKKGQVLDVISVSNGWAKINYNGKTVYASASYLKTKTATTPVSKKEMVAKVDDLNVRAGSTTKHKVLGKLNKGDKVTVISELSNGWVKIEYKGGAGYVSNVKGAYLDKVTESKPEETPVVKKEMTVKVNDLNVRSGASVKYKILGKLKEGDKVTVVEELSNGWVKIEYKGGTGYVSNVKGAYLEAGPSKAEKESAKKVIALIDALNRELTIDDKDEVLKANNEFDKLTANAKYLVTNLDVLERALIKLSELEKELEIISKNEALAKDMMNKISELDKTITLEDKSSVEKVREAYDKLSSDVKKLVTNLNILEKAEAQIAAVDTKINNAIALISAIPQDLELKDKAAVETARVAYDDLSEEEKKSVSNFHVSILKRAEARIAELVKEQDRVEGEKLTQAIEELKLLDDISLDNEEIVSRARAAYDALSEEAKASVSEDVLKVLTDAEEKITALTNEKNAKEFTNKVNSLGEDITVADFDAVSAVREAYDGLDDEAKSFVTSLDIEKLEKAEEKVEEIKASLEKAVNLISALSDEITLDDKDAVEAAREAYNEIEVANQTAISAELLEKLTNAETEIKRVEGLLEEIAEKIGAIEETINEGNLDVEKAKVEAIDILIADLGDTNASYISEEDLETLKTAKEQIATIENSKKIEAVKTLIAGLKSEITFDDFNDVGAAREAYEGLSEELKSLVTNLDKLVEAEAKVAVVKEEIARVSGLIEELSTIEITYNEKTKVEEARSAYDDMKSENKKAIEGDVLEILTNAELKVSSIKSTIDSIKDKIDEIEDDITFDNLAEEKAKVDEINALIETLNKKDIPHIGEDKLDKFRDAEIIVIRLSKVPEDVSTQNVVDLIEALPEAQDVEFSDRDAIEHARDCYNALNSDEQQGVTNLDKLVQAEAEYKRIKDGIDKLLTAIHQIPDLEDLTLEDEDKVVAARSLYDSSDEKITYYVDHIKGEYSKLVNSEDKITKLKAELTPGPDVDAQPGVPEPGVPEPGVPEPGVPEPGVPDGDNQTPVDKEDDNNLGNLPSGPSEEEEESDLF